MKFTAIRCAAAFLVCVGALVLTGCKNSRNDLADNEPHSFNQVGEARVYDEPRSQVATPKLNKISKRAGRDVAHRDSSGSSFVRIGEMDVE